MKIGTVARRYLSVEQGLLIIAAMTLCYALYIALLYSGQPLLDKFSFRQTQTALTAFWFVKDGFSFAYETPVGGAPWLIPFEFPLYQYIVAVLSSVMGFDLAATGRVVSFVFLALCVFPVSSICKNLGVSKSAFYAFVALLFSSPIYIYWARGFMIETAALFFTVASIKYFVDLLRRRDAKNILGFFVFITLSILQKSTTALPVLVVMAVIFLFFEVNKNSSLIGSFTLSNTGLAFFIFVAPVAIGLAWVSYTDIIKSSSEFGSALTSSALAKWNFGSISQRFSIKLYEDVIWGRVFKENLSGFLGAAILVSGLLFSNNKNTKIIISISVLLGLIPLFVFSNLHIVHDYYQSSSVIFMIFALSVSLGVFFERKNTRWHFFILVFVMVFHNYFAFFKGNLNSISQVFTAENSRDLAVSEVLKRQIPDDEAFLAFGNDWSSTFSYFSERKSFTVPSWFKSYDNILQSPERYLGDYPLGAVVLCPSESGPTLKQLITWSGLGRDWKVAGVADCYISLPVKHSLHSAPSTEIANCQGSLESVDGAVGDASKVAVVEGWTALSAEINSIPDRVYITLTDDSGVMVYYESIQVLRPDVNDFYGVADLGLVGFKRVIDTSTLAGKYSVGVARINKDNLELCQFNKNIRVNN